MSFRVKRGISSSAKVRDVSISLRFIAPTEPLRERHDILVQPSADCVLNFAQLLTT